VVTCLELGVDLHMAQLMPLPLTVSCFSKIQIGFAFLVPADPGSPGKRAIKRVCVCVKPAHRFASVPLPPAPLPLHHILPRPLIVCNYLCLYVDGLEGVSLKCPHPHQNVVSIVESSASNIYPVYS